jgi:hypothetical protein
MPQPASIAKYATFKLPHGAFLMVSCLGGHFQDIRNAESVALYPQYRR